MPLRSAVNLTPTSTEFGSPESVIEGVPKSKIVSSGVTAFEADDAWLVPTLLTADTVNVYVASLVRPVTSADVADALLTVNGVCAVDPMYGVTT